MGCPLYTKVDVATNMFAGGAIYVYSSKSPVSHAYYLLSSMSNVSFSWKVYIENHLVQKYIGICLMHPHLSKSPLPDHFLQYNAFQTWCVLFSFCGVSLSGHSLGKKGVECFSHNVHFIILQLMLIHYRVCLKLVSFSTCT